MSLQIKCPHCKGTYHQTTDKFTDDKKANGSMIELLPRYKKQGWSDYHTIHSNYSLLLCPYCEGQLAPTGKFTFTKERFVCECGFEAKNKGGLGAHKRFCEGIKKAA